MTVAGVCSLEACLSKRGVDTVFLSGGEARWSDLPDDTDMLLSLGGDGTYLDSVALVRGRDIPVAGINFGRLGFLTTVQASEDGFPWVDDLLAGNYTVEERDLLRVRPEEGAFDSQFHPFAANEISVQRQGTGMLSIDVLIDGRPLPTYWADGIVVATPTGSTAYSLSVGGPVVLPSSKVLILAPVAPHNLNVRPLVVPITSVISLSFRSREERAVLTVDNRSTVIESGARFVISKGEYGFRHVSLSDDNFINALRTKLLWGEDKRNADNGREK